MFFRTILIATLIVFINLAEGLSDAAQPSGPRLVGTVQGGPFSGAVFDDGSGIQTFYRLHELLPDGSKLIKIWQDRVGIKKPDGVVYELFTTGDANAVAASPSPAPSTAPTAAVSPPPPNAVSSSPAPRTTPRPRGRLGRPHEAIE